MIKGIPRVFAISLVALGRSDNYFKIVDVDRRGNQNSSGKAALSERMLFMDFTALFNASTVLQERL
jgi:hypothetical protein